jgi:putative ABC transport system ATP-binding protein
MQASPTPDPAPAAAAGSPRAPAANPPLIAAAADDTPLLELTRITKVFQTDDVETRALSNIELGIAKGEFVSINGPSGSGKSTLLAILGLLDVPSGGEYRIAGQDTARLDPVRRAALRNRCIGFIFQAFNLIGDLTVAENVELPLTYRGMPAAERKRRVAEALDGVRMAHRARHLPAQLSGGQQQRVAVARAIAGDPLILLADEPTGNLDSKNGDAVMALLEEMHGRGATICMVTHNPDYARKATRVVHLFDGRVVEDHRGG